MAHTSFIKAALEAGVSLAKLRKLGVGASDFIAIGVSDFELTQAGFTVLDLMLAENLDGLEIIANSSRAKVEQLLKALHDAPESSTSEKLRSITVRHLDC